MSSAKYASSSIREVIFDFVPDTILGTRIPDLTNESKGDYEQEDHVQNLSIAVGNVVTGISSPRTWR